jgi:hypothetical protein
MKSVLKVLCSEYFIIICGNETGSNIKASACLKYGVIQPKRYYEIAFEVF